MVWVNRLTEGHLDRPRAILVPGEWRWEGETGVKARGVAVRDGDVLLPAEDGRYLLSEGPSLRSAPAMLPDDDALRTLRRFGERLQQLHGEAWSDWVAESPLVASLDETLEETPLEGLLYEKLGHLEALCRRPRTHLKSEEERLAVSRCRRPSPRAPAVLAARSEDWGRRTIFGIEPKRILGVVREELFDIYENRVVVGLIDRLDVALVRHIRAVRRIYDLLWKIADYQTALESAVNYRQAQRMSQLWGEAVSDSDLFDQAGAFLERLRRVRRRVLALKDSLLYRKIGPGSAFDVRLRMTNVFANDELYRCAARLWRTWEDSRQEAELSPEVRWRHEQESVEGFNEFSQLLVVRAFNVLGLEPLEGADDETVEATYRLELEGPVGEVVVKHDNGQMEVGFTFENRPLRIVSLPAMLDAADDVEAWLESTADERDLLVLYLPADEPRVSDELQSRLRSLANQGDGPGTMFVPVAPWSLESVERVARALRWYLWSSFFAQYPLSFPLEVGWESPGDLPEWMTREGGGVEASLCVRRQPSTNNIDGSQEWKALQKRIERTQAKVERLELKKKALKEKHQRLGPVAEQLDVATQQLEADRSVARHLKECVDKIEKLLECPVCHAVGENRYLFEDLNDEFRCSCHQCHSSWGQASCSDCRQRFPFIGLANVTENVDSTRAQASDIVSNAELRYGCDMLAIPLSESVYLCPHCGEPSDGGGFE